MPTTKTTNKGNEKADALKTGEAAASRQKQRAKAAPADKATKKTEKRQQSPR